MRAQVREIGAARQSGSVSAGDRSKRDLVLYRNCKQHSDETEDLTGADELHEEQRAAEENSTPATIPAALGAFV